MAALPGINRDDQRVTQGRSIRGSSFIWAIVSSVPFQVHRAAGSSFPSSRGVPTSRTMASSSERIWTTSALRPILPVEAIASGPINGLDANMFISCNRSASAELLDKRAQVHYFVGRRSSVAIP